MSANGAKYIGQFKCGQFNNEGEAIFPGRHCYLKNKDGSVNGKIIFENGDVYEGSILYYLPDGIGKMKYANGNVFEGNFVRGKRSKYGKLEYAGGETYEGSFFGDLRHGYGTMKFSNGDDYVGDFKEDVISGKGKYTSVSGWMYDGNFHNGIFEGSGCLYKDDIEFNGYFSNGVFQTGNITYPDGTLCTIDYNHSNNIKGHLHYTTPKGEETESHALVSYSGILVFRKSELYGTTAGGFIPSKYGSFRYLNGDLYEGHIKNGFCSGRGTLTYKNGDTYEGQFENNLFSGSGKYCSADGWTYEGEFANGRFEGTGCLIKNGVQYVGQFNAGKFTDNGEIIGLLGNHYTITSKNGSDSGTIVFADKSVYEGNIVQYVPNGQGLMKCSNGDVYEGEFVNGKYCGRGSLKTNGTEFVGVFDNNKLINPEVFIIPQENRTELITDSNNLIGKIHYADGYEYSGDLLFGYGGIRRKDKTGKYCSQYLPHGNGVMVDPNGNIFDGLFQHGNCISGRVSYTNGDTYSGALKDYLPQDVGCMFFSDGRKYEGEWILGKFNGKGVLTNSDGSTLTITWHMGKPIGTGILFNPHKIIFKTKKVHYTN